MDREQQHVPFNRPYVVGPEFKYLADAIVRGHSAGDGHYTRLCSDLLQQRSGASSVLLTTSCTSALELAALLLDIQPGDEVIMPSYTFVSTANAFVLRGAKPVFVDIREDTLNMDERLIEAAITGRTRAIVPVHYGGVACDMDVIMDISRRHCIPVVEDAAQGVNATWKGKWLGTIGDIGTWSFHETKNVICGEGGAIVLNDKALIERAEILREKGTNRSQFLRGQVDKYTWVDVGGSFLLSDLLSAFLFAQLEHMDDITRRRKSLWQRYDDALRPVSERLGLDLPVVPDGCVSNCHMYHVRVRSMEERDAMIADLRKRDMQSVFHYVPLHTSPFARGKGWSDYGLPITEREWSRLLRLPLYPELQDEDVDQVIDSVIQTVSTQVCS
ncbi:MAG: dTDP-4-amino-4,6-dideoxygalactose transaminase [Phycisphaerales bacterium]|jgi:dTDP-4-amino-4,6-dideoxygalactose transaminase|nr:dTDP-4-amino-4,6-dideoxygalactose transaminase [Phycisphaerales bacterium]